MAIFRLDKRQNVRVVFFAKKVHFALRLAKASVIDLSPVVWREYVKSDSDVGMCILGSVFRNIFG